MDWFGRLIGLFWPADWFVLAGSLKFGLVLIFSGIDYAVAWLQLVSNGQTIHLIANLTIIMQI